MIKTPQEPVFFYAKMDEKTTPTREAAKAESTPSRGTLMSYMQNFSKEAIDLIVDCMRNDRNPAIRMGAAKLILERTIPVLKAIELTGDNGEPIKLNIISGADYLSAFGVTGAPSAAGLILGSGNTQGARVAPASTQDNDGSQPDSQVESA